MRRFTRSTNGHSKKLANHAAAVALHFLHYNYARPHKTLANPYPRTSGDGRRAGGSRLVVRGNRWTIGLGQLTIGQAAARICVHTRRFRPSGFSLPQAVKMAVARRVSVYVDGFNLYYGLLKPDPAVKWLDLSALAAALRPGAAVRVHYFTAKVRPLPDPIARVRQRLYLKALETLPNVTIHYGHFTAHQVRMAYVTPPPGGQRTALVWKTEEKGSDVNLATCLLLDGHDNLYDEAVVISGDSDLVEPVREANARFAPVHVLNPRNLHSELAQVASSYGALNPALLPACQLPNTVNLPTGRSVTRPTEYR